MSVKILIAFFFFPGLYSCAQQKKDVLKLQSVTILPIADEMGLVYSDTSISTVSMYQRDEVPAILEEAKKKKGDSLIVYVRKTDLVSPKTITDIERLLSEKNIKNYLIEDFDEADRKLISIALDNFRPPETVEIKIPASVNVQELPDDNALLIEIRNDQTVWYKILEKGINHPLILTKEPVTKNLKEIIARFAANGSTHAKSYLIKGDNQSGFKVFEKVINALKANNIYKYNLITSMN